MSLPDELENEIYAVINNGKIFQNDLDAAIPLYASQLRKMIKEERCPDYVFNVSSFLDWYLHECSKLTPLTPSIGTTTHENSRKDISPIVSTPSILGEDRKHNNVQVSSIDNPLISADEIIIEVAMAIGNSFSEFFTDLLNERIWDLTPDVPQPFKYGNNIHNMIHNIEATCKMPMTIDGITFNCQSEWVLVDHQ
jgi:hypothetical protein